MESTEDGMSAVRALLSRAHPIDLDRLADVLDQWPRPKKLAEARLGRDRAALEDAIAEALADAATSDMVRAFAGVRGKRADVDVQLAITRTAKRIGVSVVPFGTVEGRLAALAEAVVDYEILRLPAEEQARVFDREKTLLQRCVTTAGALGAARAASLPALHQVATKVAVTRIPLALGTLGPIAWAISGVWMFWEIQGPAQRKVVPALFYLGLVAARPTSLA